MPLLPSNLGNPGNPVHYVQRYRLPLLAAVAVGLVWLNLHAPAPQQLVQVAQRNAALVPLVAEQLSPTTLTTPDQQDRPALEPAQRDPFAAPAPPVVAKVAPVLPPPPIATPVAPSAPPHGLTFAGRITTPDGREQVYLALGDTSVAIVAGQTLPSGYRVESITARAIELSYPPLNTTARLDLPAPPKYEIR